MDKAKVAEERRSQILEAALRCFARQGYHRTTMDDIVEESGLSKGTLYWYYESKKKIFLSVMEKWLDEWGKSLYGSFSPQDPPAEKLRKLNQVMIRSGLELRDLLPVVMEFWSQATQDEAIKGMLRAMFEEYDSLISGILQEGISRGEFREANVHHLASILVAAYDGLLFQWMLNPEAFPWPETATTLIETFLASMTKK
jgi:AcrR family transcriptional regulator